MPSPAPRSHGGKLRRQRCVRTCLAAPIAGTSCARTLEPVDQGACRRVRGSISAATDTGLYGQTCVSRELQDDSGKQPAV